MRFFYLTLIVFGSFHAFSQPRLLKDVNNEAASGNLGSLLQATDVRIHNGKAYFPAYSGPVGSPNYVYITDGTSAGTKALPRVNTVEVYNVTFAGNRIITYGLDLKTGIPGLWSSDGIQTPQLISEHTPYGILWASFGDVFYYNSVDEEHGNELWRTDGTADGTYMIKDINEGTGDALQDFSEAKAIGNTIFFFADDGVHGRELWKTDGTAQGTQLVFDINPDGDAITYSTTTVIGTDIYFVADDNMNGIQVWKSDGTAEGTVMVTEMEGGVTTYADFVGVGDKWITTDYTFETGIEYYVLDITTGGYSLLKDINPGGNSSTPGTSTQIVVLNGSVYFNAKVDDEYSLWKTDGTTENTVKLTTYDLPPGISTKAMTANNGKLLVTSVLTYAFDTDEPGVLMVGDGINAFTTLKSVKSVDNILALNDKFFLGLDDLSHGAEPWISDGTLAGTFMLQDINSMPQARVTSLTNLDNKILFTNFDGLNKYEIWASDGTDKGTIALVEGKSLSNFRIEPGTNEALFAWDDGVHGLEPWITDGTVAGTKMLKDVTAGAGSTTLHAMKWLNGTAYFSVGNQLWKTDGTTEGTAMFSNKPGAVYNHDMVAFKNAIYFLAGKNLWKTDGTDEGTVIIKQIPEIFWGSARTLKAGENKMFFTGDDGTHGYELWVSDGTTEGTHMTRDIHDESFPSYGEIRPGVIVNDVVYFFANEQDTWTLWRSDGTEEGTHEIGDFSSTQILFSSDIFGPVGNKAFFVAYDQTHGRELWVTNGTDAGTHMVKDVSSNGGSLIYSTVAFDNNLYFVVDDGTHGYELWKTDGTEAGTSLAFEIAEGPTDSFNIFTSFAQIDNTLFFNVTEPQNGNEVWLYNPDFLDQTITFTELPDKKTSDEPFELVASASSGLPVSFEVVSGPATISGSTITLTTDVGTVTVRAMQEGNIDYNPASAEQSFDVKLILGLEEEHRVVVWPNPATSTLILNAPSSFKTAVIKDVLGRDILAANVSGENTSVNVSHLPRGMYFVKFNSDNQSAITRKVILK